jgi:hypothetical protein
MEAIFISRKVENVKIVWDIADKFFIFRSENIVTDVKYISRPEIEKAMGY